ncbi:uncharacterized protein LOC117292250 isoform X2 [Asterias rubens]|uniref:uncharacterized protein LOC117292250 isoform X2 n=1 Tax=Asterias rubens TaxID=7604 RepID=UPI00145535E9|nr:uncharacterized protein LOC117292250 isoform X2 [Asterias rubens]
MHILLRNRSTKARQDDIAFCVVLGMGVCICRYGMCSPLGNNQQKQNQELVKHLNEVCQENNKETVYEEELNMCVSCSSCHLHSQDDHCHTCRAFGIIPTPVFEVTVQNTDEKDDPEPDNAHDKSSPDLDSSSDMGLPVAVVGVVVCCGGVTLVAMGLLFKRRNVSGMLPVPQHDCTAAYSKPKQETGRPDKFHPSNDLSHIKLDQQDFGGTETMV